MKPSAYQPWLIVCWLLWFPAVAQLQISSPVSRMVFQRNLRNEATLLIAGTAPASATLIEARLVPLSVGQGNVTSWTPLPRLRGSSGFRGFITASAGWYRLDVRARNQTALLAEAHVNRVGVGEVITASAGWYRLDVRARNQTALLAEAHVNRVGVGEVFVTAGQSNAAGGFQRVPGAVDDRVSCVDFRQDSLSEQLLPLQFSHISYGTSIGPGQPPHIWGLLGDKLVQRLNVPVLFLGAALGGTSSDQWRQSAAGTPGSAVYRRLGAVLLHYIRRTGARAVLWHQGEGDINTGTQTYFDNIRYVIEKSRQQVNDTLPWVVARVSYASNQTNPGVIAAQNQLINTVPAVFAGPATDNLTGADNRPDGIHFGGNGLYRFTDRWDQSLTDTFFATAVPFTPTDTLSLLTSGYTLPLTRRPGETLTLASLRNVPADTATLYTAQVIRTSDGTVVLESSPTSANPISVTLPANLTEGQYQYRIRSIRPALAGALSEPFLVRRAATPMAAGPVLRLPERGGLPPASLLRLGYRYESESHSFFAMMQGDSPLEVRLQRIDGGSFSDSGWGLALPSSQAPDYTDFADFSYLRNYPPIANGVGGVDPGRYRLSVRAPGDTGSGFWFEMLLLNGRNILYYPMEPVTNVPPVLAMTLPQPCLNKPFSVSVSVDEGTLNPGNVFSVRLSDARGSFVGETVLNSSSTSPISVTLPAGVSDSSGYRLRVVASKPAVASAPSRSLAVCAASDQTDLSLAMRVSNRTPHVNQPVSVTLTLTNAGTQSASNIRLSSRLPDGLRFLDTTSPAVSGQETSVSIQSTSLAGGTSQPFVFRIQPRFAGSFVTSAQITASSLTDPDSQPDSGTGDGQDDMTQVDIRTAEAGNQQTTSPNPDQVSLPAVESSQPSAGTLTADLSLSVTVGSLLISPGETVSLSLTVSNRGGTSAGNVGVQMRLPAGWRLVSTDSLTVDGQSVKKTLATIGPNGSETFVLTLRPTGTGTLTGQILSATTTDPDSTPGNGYANGEDDEVSLTLRSR